MRTLRIPLQLDSRRRIGVASTTSDVVRAQITDILVTGRRERPFRPGYGAGLPDQLFANVDPAIFGAMESDIRDELASRVKGATITSVRITELSMVTTAVNVEVMFTLIPGGEEFAAVQTFTGIATEESFANG